MDSSADQIDTKTHITLPLRELGLNWKDRGSAVPGRDKKAHKSTCVYNFNAVTLPSWTISFCNTLDFIINTLIAWKCTTRRFSAQENTP